MKAIALTSLFLFLTTAYSDALEVVPPLPGTTASVVIEPAGHINSPLQLAISCSNKMVTQYNFSILGLGAYNRGTMQSMRIVRFGFQIDDEEVSSPDLRAERYRGGIVLSTSEDVLKLSSYPLEGLRQVQDGMEMRSPNGDVFLYGAESLSEAIAHLERKCEDLSFSSQLMMVEIPSDLQRYNLVPLHYEMGSYYKSRDKGSREEKVHVMLREVGIGSWTSIERARSLTSLAKVINSIIPKADIRLTLLAGGADRKAVGIVTSTLSYSADSDTLVVDGSDFQVGEDFYFLLQKYVEADVHWPYAHRKREKLEFVYNQFRKEYGGDPEQLNENALNALEMEEFNLSLSDAPAPFTYKLVLQDVRSALCDELAGQCF
ncbi:hypothetical protein [Pseudovibrio ascidiaceicola]|uniref:hypothetical protein n=1 Tax=Pseudovibrio ascidiaceicola TaxID=285279 RepID=UPI000D689766|nr:hypothetical protein [Pseudovibrio ascidiaceicola]